MNYPLVSAIIPVYNAEETIIRALRSIENQTYRPIEVHVVDDGSSDSSVEQIKQFQNDATRKIRLIRHTRQRGPGFAQKTGIDHASGDYIAFLDADDLWKPRKIEKQVKRLHDGSAALCFTDLEIFNENGEFIGERRNDFDQPRELIIRDIYLSKICNMTPTAVFRKDLLDSIPYLEGNLEYKFDHWFFMRAIDERDFVRIPQRLAERHYTDTIGARAGRRNLRDELRSSEKFSRRAIKRFPYLKKYRDRFLTHAYFSRITEPNFPDEKLSAIRWHYLSPTDQMKYWVIRLFGRPTWNCLREFK